MNSDNFINRKEKILKEKKFYGINHYLFNSYMDAYYVLEDIDQYKLDNIANFLSTTNVNLREDYAENLIKEYWKTYKKIEQYTYFFEKLMKSELGIKIFNEYQRDHIVHSAYVFLLGIYLFMKDRNIKESLEVFNEYNDSLESNKFVFMWNIISTFHDIGYPFESFSIEMNSYIMDKLNKLGANVDNYQKNNFEVVINNLDILSNGESSFDIMKDLLSKHDCKNRSFDLREYFNFKLKKGKVDHGILSSLFLLKVTDIIYSQRRYSEDFFRDVFSEIALSIALHNIKWPKVIKEMKIKKEELPEITLRDFPFCYLLILADTLQEWDRPAVARPSLPSTAVSIIFNDKEERFHVKFALSKEDIRDIRRELRDKISTTDEKMLPKISAAFKLI